MTFEIITETNLAIGPFPTMQEAVAKAETLGLGEQRHPDGDDRAPGWFLSVAALVTPH